jgi:Fur family ferric uptake transcriptional regulator
MRCGRVDEFVDEVIEKRQREKAQELGYKLTEHSLIMYGQCLKGDSCPNFKKKG